MSEGYRKLATVETIDSIRPIPNADSIECARVRGWDVVVKKGEFEPGDKCVYFEIDTMLDVSLPQFAFLAAHNVRTDASGRKGHVLRTMRLRGQISQGLILPLSAFAFLIYANNLSTPDTDLTGWLTMGQWEPPLSADLIGKAKGHRPGWIHKTDEERAQNLQELLANYPYLDWVATEKIDGTSVTFYFDGEEFGCCTRNLNLIETENNTVWEIARRLDIERKLRAIAEPVRALSATFRIAIQGELFGEGIQKNPLKMRGHHFAMFNYIISGIDVERVGWEDWMLALSVPVLDIPFPDSLEEALEQASKQRSHYRDTAAEGIVWRAQDADTVQLDTGVVKASFKVISNSYLLKHGE